VGVVARLTLLLLLAPELLELPTLSDASVSAASSAFTAFTSSLLLLLPLLLLLLSSPLPRAFLFRAIVAAAAVLLGPREELE
jgi:hypothetical protein